MHAVMSLWTKPRPVTSDHRVMMGLSLLMAKAHFPRVRLVTDSAGAELVHRMGFPFDEITTDLDHMDAVVGPVPASAWAAGKLFAYMIQSEPFIHLDQDVFLFSPLPASLLASPVFAQSKEGWELYEKDLAKLPWAFVEELTLPKESWCAYNAGILGGQDVDAITNYSANALNALVRAKEPPYETMAVFEQAYLARFCHDNDIPVATLIEGDHEAESKGYCHLMNAKQEPSCMIRVRRRLEREDPELYRRAVLAGR